MSFHNYYYILRNENFFIRYYVLNIFIYKTYISLDVEKALFKASE